MRIKFKLDFNNLRLFTLNTTNPWLCVYFMSYFNKTKLLRNKFNDSKFTKSPNSFGNVPVRLLKLKSKIYTLLSFNISDI